MNVLLFPYHFARELLRGVGMAVEILWPREDVDDEIVRNWASLRDFEETGKRVYFFGGVPVRAYGPSLLDRINREYAEELAAFDHALQ